MKIAKGAVVKYLNWIGVIDKVYSADDGTFVLEIVFDKNIFQSSKRDIIAYDPDDELGRLQPASQGDLAIGIDRYFASAYRQADALLERAIQ